MKRWLYILLSFVVLSICSLTAALAIDCHLIEREGKSLEVCKGSDERALSTLMALLSTLLALRVPASESDGDVTAGR